MIYSTPPPMAQEYICGGGETDKNGITWEVVGRFWATPDDAIKGNEKYCKFYPIISKGTMIVVGYEAPVPDRKDMAPGAWKEYQRLLKVSESYIITVDGKQWRVGRFKK